MAVILSVLELSRPWGRSRANRCCEQQLPRLSTSIWYSLPLDCARPDACGALMASRGAPVTQVTRDLVRFKNGLAVYKARLNVGNSVAIWNWKEADTGGAADETQRTV
jgi:hypothetical protein